jgi:hypothetical protein
MSADSHDPPSSAGDTNRQLVVCLAVRVLAGKGADWALADAAGGIQMSVPEKNGVVPMAAGTCRKCGVRAAAPATRHLAAALRGLLSRGDGKRRA